MSRTEYDLLAIEGFAEVTAAAEASDGLSPGRWVGAATGNVRGDGIAVEEVDGNFVVSPFGSENTALVRIESRTVGVLVGGRDTTADVRVLACGVDVAVGGVDRAGEGSGAAGGVYAADAAAGSRVEGEFVGVLIVGALDDIDFAVVWPVGTYEPEGWPRAADSSGHVVEVEDEEARFVRSLASDANTGASAWSVAGGVNAHFDVRCR